MALTRDDFLLPHAHLVVDQAVLLHVVAVLHQLGAHLLQGVVVDERLRGLRALAGADHVLGHGLLLLQRGEPARVELFPELETLRIMGLVVAH